MRMIGNTVETKTVIIKTPQIEAIAFLSFLST
jgi:hypothetical protein